MYNILEFNPSSKYREDISLGKNYPNNFSIYKFGRNANVDTNEVIIAEGGVYGLPNNAETVTITSDSANDVLGGSGARTVKIFGLDVNYNMIEEVVNIGDTSANSYLRVYRAFVLECGNSNPIGGSNDGEITIAQSTSLVEMIKIGANDGQTLCACFTIPAGYSGLAWQAETNTGQGKSCIARLKTRDNTISDSTFLLKGIRDNFQNEVGNIYQLAPLNTEKTDILFTAQSSASGIAISASFILQLIKN